MENLPRDVRRAPLKTVHVITFPKSRLMGRPLILSVRANRQSGTRDTCCWEGQVGLSVAPFLKKHYIVL